MANYKGGSDDDDKIDLELKLGPYREEKQEERGNNHSICMGGSSSVYMGSGGGKSLVVYPQPNSAPPPNRKRPIVDENKVCKACGSNNTPLWRKGPQGPQTLCNACGLRHLRTIKKGGE